MKSFFKNVLANVVAIFIVGAMLFCFFLIMMIVGSLTGGDKVKIQNDSILTLNEKMQIIDSPGEDQPSLFFLAAPQHSKVLLKDVLFAIKNAKTDDKIKGISIETDYIMAGLTQLDDIRAALEDFKSSGKFVYAYGNGVTQSGYYLGSVASSYYLNPMGMIDLKGMSSEVVYMKGFIEKYGIGMDVIRHGKFKAAVEPFLRESISEENKEQLSTLLGDLWGDSAQKIANSRSMSADEFKLVTDSLYGMIPENALKYKLADKLIQKSQYEDLIRSKIAAKKDSKLNRVSFAKYIESTKDSQKTGADQIAILYASGAIYNGEGHDGIYSQNYIEYIQKLKDDDKVKAVVLRINSPGGSANASEEILYELQQLKAKKPLVVSFGDYAASGGYYIAMAGDKIYSEPNTLTGSIGVFGMIPNYKELANRNGIRSDVVQTNENTVYHSWLQGLTPAGERMFTNSVEHTYKKFVHWVTANRKQTFEQIDAIGGGRIWSGKRAKELGLVDELGSLDQAIAEAAKRAKMTDYTIESFPKKVSLYEQLIKDLNSDQLYNKVLKNKLGEDKFKLFETISSPESKPQIMMESFYRVKID
ncbi:signal peptide peptidase SppA [Chryseobacterium sp. A321]